jgi:predicted ATP-grasp superfamily ATP-dependent carboligase
MRIPLLLVATTTTWYGTARMPRALARAGFDVTLLTPRGALAEHSRYVARIAYLDHQTTTRQWIDRFAATVAATAPRLVMPCDDMAFRLLQAVVEAPPGLLAPALQLALSALIRESLGDPAYYATSVDKLLLPEAAQALGVRVPPWALVATAEAAQAFAAVHGYPVVLKRSHSSAGSGVEICADAAAVAAAFDALAASTVTDVAGASEPRLLVQVNVRGVTRYYQAMAWRGRLLSGFGGEKVVGHPEPKGPSTVNRYHRSPTMRAMAQTLVAGFGMSGFLALECLVDERDGTTYLIEINRRLVPGAHRGTAFGIDHCAALHAAIEGRTAATRSDLDADEEHLSVHFPQEWLRDPESERLRLQPVDVPWDEPELIRALLALGRET